MEIKIFFGFLFQPKITSCIFLANWRLQIQGAAQTSIKVGCVSIFFTLKILFIMFKYVLVYSQKYTGLAHFFLF